MTAVREAQFCYGVVVVTIVEMCRFYDGRVKRTVMDCFFFLTTIFAILRTIFSIQALWMPVQGIVHAQLSFSNEHDPKNGEKYTFSQI